VRASSAPTRVLSRLAFTAAPSLLLLTLLGRAAQNAGQTTYPLIGRELLGMGNSSIGAVVAVAGLASVACSTVVVGRARRWPPARLLAAGQALGLAAFLLLALPTGRPGLWLGAVGLGAGGGLVFPSLMTVIASRSPGRRAKALALMAVALSTSLVAGPLIESGVLHVLGGSLRAALGVMTVLPAGAVALAVRAARQRATTADGPGADGPSAQGAGLPADGPGADGPGPQEAPAAASAPADAPPAFGSAFRLALTVMLTYQVPFVALVGFGALLARQADGLSAAGAEAAFAVFFGSSALVRVLLVVATPRRRLRGVLVVSAAATVAGVAWLGLADTLPELLGAMAVLGVPHGTTFPLASSILAEQAHLDDARLARANGRLMAGTNAATVVVPFAYGALAAAFGYREAFLLLEVPVGLAAALLVAQLASRRSPLRAPDAFKAPSLGGP
jgi:DHA1 family multidrug resistance protein-like MFS transporter